MESERAAHYKYRFGDLTWPEVNEAVEARKVIILPIGSTEQHGKHLPIDTDNLIAESIAVETGRRVPEKILVAPTIPYGYNIHAIDFPGTMHVSYEHLINYCVDVCKSFVYHGFKRIIILNGHGGNSASLELVARRTILETDGLVTAFMWWNMLRVNPKFIASFRESKFPGGCNHACEVETSMYLHLAPERVQMDKAADHQVWYNAQGETGFEWADAFGSGPVRVVEWSSTFVDEGAVGEPTRGTADKGRRIMEEAVQNLIRFIDEFRNREYRARVDHHSRNPSSSAPSV